MQGAWRQSDEGGREMLCIPGDANNPDQPTAAERQAMQAGCEWTGGTCTTLDNGAGGTYSCSPGTASRLRVEMPGPGQAPQNALTRHLPDWLQNPSRSYWPWIIGGGVVILGVGGVFWWLSAQRAERRRELEAQLRELQES